MFSCSIKPIQGRIIWFNNSFLSLRKVERMKFCLLGILLVSAYGPNAGVRYCQILVVPIQLYGCEMSTLHVHKERRLGIREEGPDKAKNPKPMTLYTPWSPGQPYFRTTLLQAGLVLPWDQSQLFVQDGLSMYLWRQVYTAVGKGRNS